MNDREIAYEQNVTGLEIAWRERIERFAASAVDALWNDSEYDIDGMQIDASETVAARLLDSSHWENVNATDISDIAYEAVSREIDSRTPRI